MNSAKDREAAQTAAVAVFTKDVCSKQRDLVFTHELYTRAARDFTFRGITNTWLARGRALEQHFNRPTARCSTL